MRETGSLVTERPAGRPDVLASDADREAVAGVLSSAFAEGRLTAAEHAERVRAAYAARTSRELGRLISDLPVPGAADYPGDRTTVVRDDMDWCMRCALLICWPPAGIAYVRAARRRSLRGSDAADR